LNPNSYPPAVRKSCERALLDTQDEIG
jgi:hypothetical protein